MEGSRVLQLVGERSTTLISKRNHLCLLVPLTKGKPGSVCSVLGGDGRSPGCGGHGWMWGRGQDAGSSRFVAHQCMAGGPHLRGAAQGSELCCTCSKLLQLYLSTAFHVGYSPRSCIQLLSPAPSAYSVMGQHKQAQNPGVQDTGCRDGARGHSSCQGASRGFMIGPKSSPVEGSHLQSITSPFSKWRGK